MVVLRDPAVCPFERIASIAFVIKRNGQFLHAGLLYRDEDGVISLIHLGWNYLLTQGPPDDSYYWVPCSLDERVQEDVAGFLEVLWKKNRDQRVPYSTKLSSDLNFFDERGERIQVPVGDGLTCASFVLHVFRALELPLVIADEWPTGREGDKEWAREILSIMQHHCDQKKYGLTQEHIDEQAKCIEDIVRHRPEEVAAAFDIFVGAPIPFKEVEEPGERLRRRLICA